MKKLTPRDRVATVLVLLIAVPYVGFLVGGSMPFVDDVRGMAGVGLVLGSLAFMVIRSGDEDDTTGRAESALALLSLVLGVAVVALAEVAAADALLAAFMASILLVWAVEVADHTGAVHWHGDATGA